MNTGHHGFRDILPEGWRTNRMGNVAEVLFSNVDKYTFESEVPVRLCNCVDVYKNDRITSEIESMGASAEPREIARQVTEEKIADPAIRTTVQANRDDRIYLEGAYRGQVNGDNQTTYDARGRYEELADPKYTDTDGIFDIMAVTVIQTHLSLAA